MKNNTLLIFIVIALLFPLLLIGIVIAYNRKKICADQQDIISNTNEDTNKDHPDEVLLNT